VLVSSTLRDLVIGARVRGARLVRAQGRARRVAPLRSRVSVVASHGITELVIGPVRWVLRPVRFGSISIDLAFTAVFAAVIVLRIVVVPLIPF
jgi:hypothetical protein